MATEPKPAATGCLPLWCCSCLWRSRRQRTVDSSAPVHEAWANRSRIVVSTPHGTTIDPAPLAGETRGGTAPHSPGTVTTGDADGSDGSSTSTSADTASSTSTSSGGSLRQGRRRQKPSSSSLEALPEDSETAGFGSRSSSSIGLLPLRNRRRISFTTPDLSVSDDLMRLVQGKAAVEVQRHYRGYLTRRDLVRRGVMKWKRYHRMRTREEVELAGRPQSQLSSEKILPQRSLDRMFSLGEKLGSGNYATVRRGSYCDASKEGEMAIKIVEKWRLKLASERQALLQEVELMRRIDHANCVRLLEVHETDREYYLCMEYLEGGDLFDHITAGEEYDEFAVSTLLRQVLEALQYLHSLEIVHRDIKPENIMVLDGLVVKLIDFGLSAVCKSPEKLTYTCGTPTYIAPEVITEPVKYDEKVDVWAVGVIMYILLGSGVAPFRAGRGDTEGLYRVIREAALDLATPDFQDTTEEGRSLLSLLLLKDPAERPSAKRVLCHPWLHGDRLALQGRRVSADRLVGFVVARQARQRWQGALRKLMAARAFHPPRPLPPGPAAPALSTPV